MIRLDDDAKEFCTKIALKMAAIYGITVSDAAERIYRYWDDREIVGEHIFYHETPEYWARAIHTGRRDWWRTKELP